MRNAVIIAALFIAALPSARAELFEIQWSADGRFTHQGSIASGKFVEVCGKLPAGVKVLWDFEAGAAVDFNVHYHAGKAVVFPVKLSAVSSGTDTLAVKIDQDYCWMWTNKSAAAATLTVHLQR